MEGQTPFFFSFSMLCGFGEEPWGFFGFILFFGTYSIMGFLYVINEADGCLPLGLAAWDHGVDEVFDFGVDVVDRSTATQVIV